MIYKRVEEQFDDFLCDFCQKSLFIARQSTFVHFIIFFLYEINLVLNSGCLHFEIIWCNFFLNTDGMAIISKAIADIQCIFDQLRDCCKKWKLHNYVDVKDCCFYNKVKG